MPENHRLDRLFNPSSLAIIGASKHERKSGGRFLKGLIFNSGFKGKLYPVNPRESEVMGLPCYSSIMDIPGEVDLAIITVPAGLVPQCMVECSQKGVRFAIVHGAGFSELGTEGKELESEMLKAARQGGPRIIGPNCMGLYCPEADINTILADVHYEKETGPVAFAGQSGWVTENFIEMGYERGLRFSKAVSIGNQSDLTIEDMLEYFGNDSDTGVIGFYIEGIKRGKEFLRLAKEVSKKKPIIVWKSGRSEVGVRAVASHTGSLAGNHVVFDAALSQSGIIAARNLEELVDLAVGFTCPVLPAGKKVGLLMEAGGGASAGADAAEALGLEIPTLSTESQKELVARLEGILPPFSSPRNPVDIIWAPENNPEQIFSECSRILLKEVDAVVIIGYLNFDDRLAKELSGLRDSTGKPIFIIPGHTTERRDGMSLLVRNGIPSFSIPEKALKALSAMVHYSNYQKQS
ncbi:MAG: acetate--CoA ligase family protein [Promethearchaeota archaeon]